MAPEQDPPRSDLGPGPPRGEDTPEAKPGPPPKSFGNMGEHHWSVARKASNQEALDYYRERSKAPGVEEGGGARNHYCMHCDGVIPFDHRGEACPHCGATLDEGVRRYFNWVEIDQPPSSDLIPLLKVAVPVLLLLATLGVLLVRWLFGG